MTIQHPNFYENLQEAHRRLLRSVVTYDDEPYFILAITNHKPGGIFRVYLEPLGRYEQKNVQAHGADNYHTESPDLGPYLDKWMDSSKTSGILRKRIDAKNFNRFRPFPLGMCNHRARTYYLERQPLRQGHQGLIRGHISETAINLASDRDYVPGQRTNVETMSSSFRACVRGEHPSARDVLKGLKDSSNINDAAAFHRSFALIRGPIDMLFLAYKADIVGVLPRGDFSELTLGRDFKHTREVVADLKLFTAIV